MDVDVKKITPRCYTNEDGDKVFNYLLPFLKKGESVCISFTGIDAIPSSFVNTAFIPLLDHFDFEYIKKLLSFSNTSKQINEIITSRFLFEVAKRTSN